MECLALLFQNFGRLIGQLMDETSTLLFKFSVSKSVVVRTTAVYAISKMFQGTNSSSYLSKTVHSSMKNLKTIINSDTSQTVKVYAVNALRYLVINTKSPLYLPDLEHSILQLTLNHMHTAMHVNYQASLGNLLAGCLSASQDTSLKITKGKRVAYEKCLEYLFTIASSGKLSKSGSKLSTLTFKSVKPTANSHNSVLFALKIFFTNLGPDHLESHIRTFLHYLSEYCLDEQAYRFTADIAVDLLSEKFCNSLIKKCFQEMKKNIPISQKNGCLYIILNCIKKLGSSSLTVVESEKVISKVLASGTAVHEKAKFFATLSSILPQVMYIIINQTISFLPNWDDPENTLKILEASEIIYACLARIDLKNSEKNDFTGISSDTPIEIFTFGESMVTCSQNQDIIRSGWILIHACLLVEPDQFQPRVAILVKNIRPEADGTGSPDSYNISQDHLIENVKGALKTCQYLEFNEYNYEMIQTLFCQTLPLQLQTLLYKIILNMPRRFVKDDFLNSLVEKCVSDLAKPTSGPAIKALSTYWNDLHGEIQESTISRLKSQWQKLKNTDFPIKVIEFLSSLSKFSISGQTAADIIWLSYGGLAKQSEISKQASKAIVNACLWCDNTAEVSRRVYDLAITE